MLQLLRDILQSEAGSFGFVFSLIAFVGFAIWKVSHFTTKFKTVEKMEGNIDGIKEDIQYLKANFQIIRENNNSLVQAHSPISFTEKGENYYNELKIADMITSHWDYLLQEIDKVVKDSKNPYDIQQACFEIGRRFSSFLTDSELDVVKKHAYDKGESLDIYNVLFGVPLRDKLLKKFGYNLEDVDRHEPKE